MRLSVSSPTCLPFTDPYFSITKGKRSKLLIGIGHSERSTIYQLVTKCSFISYDRLNFSQVKILTVVICLKEG